MQLLIKILLFFSFVKNAFQFRIAFHLFTFVDFHCLINYLTRILYKLTPNAFGHADHPE